MAATAAGARDATRLGPLVSFYLFYILLIHFLGPLNTSKRRWQQQQQGFKALVCYYYIFYTTVVFILG